MMISCKALWQVWVILSCLVIAMHLQSVSLLQRQCLAIIVISIIAVLKNENALKVLQYSKQVHSIHMYT